MGTRKHAHAAHAHGHHHSGRKQLFHRVSAPFLISGAIIYSGSENVNGRFTPKIRLSALNFCQSVEKPGYLPASVGADDAVRPAESSVLRKSSANSHARKAPLGHKGSWPNGPEGIRTLQISENSELCNKSPPSFSSKMPPPLTVRGTARGGFSSAPQLIDTTNRQTGSARK